MARRHAAGKGGIAEFRSVFPQVVAELPRLAEETAHKVAEEIADGAVQRSNAQYAGDNPFDIKVVDTPNQDTGDHGAAVYADWYWHFGEFGTAHQPARPYMIPALEAVYTKVNPAAAAVFAKLPRLHEHARP